MPGSILGTAVRRVEDPALIRTPDRVWHTIRDAEAGTLIEPWSEPPAVFATLPVRGGAAGDPEAASVDV